MDEMRFRAPAKSLVTLGRNAATGAFSLIPPGTRLGPCPSHCEHQACADSRRAAETPCNACGKPPGYGVPIYNYPTRHGHAACFDEGVWAGKKKAIENLVELAFQQFEEGKWPPSRLAGPSEPLGPCAACEHKECVDHRRRAESACFECGEAIGYERLYVHRPRGLAHADCAKVAPNEMEQYRDDVTGVEEPAKEYVEVVPRYELPEYDIFVEIPCGRGRGGRTKKDTAAKRPKKPAPESEGPPSFEGRWTIDLGGEAGTKNFIEFDATSAGQLRFGTVTCAMECERGTRDGLPAVEFSWSGVDGEKPVNGRGWAVCVFR